MASTLNQLVSDPDFKKLPPAQQKQLLTDNFPDFAQLSGGDQDTFLKDYQPPSANPTTDLPKAGQPPKVPGLTGPSREEEAFAPLGQTGASVKKLFQGSRSEKFQAASDLLKSLAPTKEDLPFAVAGGLAAGARGLLGGAAGAALGAGGAQGATALAGGSPEAQEFAGTAGGLAGGAIGGGLANHLAPELSDIQAFVHGLSQRSAKPVDINALDLLSPGKTALKVALKGRGSLSSGYAAMKQNQLQRLPVPQPPGGYFPQTEDYMAPKPTSPIGTSELAPTDPGVQVRLTDPIPAPTAKAKPSRGRTSDNLPTKKVVSAVPTDPLPEPPELASDAPGMTVRFREEPTPAPSAPSARPGYTSDGLRLSSADAREAGFGPNPPPTPQASATKAVKVAKNQALKAEDVSRMLWNGGDPAVPIDKIALLRDPEVPAEVKEPFWRKIEDLSGKKHSTITRGKILDAYEKLLSDSQTSTPSSPIPER